MAKLPSVHNCPSSVRHQTENRRKLPISDANSVQLLAESCMEWSNRRVGLKSEVFATFEPKTRRILIYVNGKSTKIVLSKSIFNYLWNRINERIFPPPTITHLFYPQYVSLKKSLKGGQTHPTHKCENTSRREKNSTTREKLAPTNWQNSNIRQTCRNNLSTLSRRVEPPTFDYLGGLNSSPTLRRCNSYTCIVCSF